MVYIIQVSITESYWQKLDRKSTRLNSSHANISYAVLCLTKHGSPSSRPARSASHAHPPRRVVVTVASRVWYGVLVLARLALANLMHRPRHHGSFGNSFS